MQNWLKLGEWNAICDSCGRKFKASTMRKRWDGLFVCEEDFEIKHPQLSMRVQADKQMVPIARPDPVEDTFLTGFCTPITRQAVAETGTADCATVDYLVPVDISDTTMRTPAIAGQAIAGTCFAGIISGLF